MASFLILCLDEDDLIRSEIENFSYILEKIDTASITMLLEEKFH